MNMNLKGIMQTLGAKPGQVVSNPYVRAFAPQPTITEGEGEDHEVSMANNSIDTIIKMATELKAKMGEDEKQIPAWIQDHIAKAENFISQASSNYHEYGTNESVNEAESDNVNWDVIENVFVNFLIKNTKELQRRVKAKHLDSTKSGIKSIISGLVNAQRSLKLESVNEDLSVEAYKISRMIGSAQQTTQDFIDDNKIDVKKLELYIRNLSIDKKYIIRDIIDGSIDKRLTNIKKMFIKQVKESVNEANKSGDRLTKLK